MLYVRFLSSLSPPLDTFATLSKVYRPSQTPHPAMSSKDKGRCQEVPSTGGLAVPCTFFPLTTAPPF